MKPVFLITDIFYFLFLGLSLWFFLWARKEPLYQELGRRLRRKRLAWLALFVVAMYLGIAFLDSLHFRLPRKDASGAVLRAKDGTAFSGDMLSVLDWVLASGYGGVRFTGGGIQSNFEESYSRPLAAVAFEPLIDEDPRTGEILLTRKRLEAPRRHLLGTDQAGGDIFYQVLKGVRTGIIVGLVTTLIAVPFAVAFGIPAGYFGGRVDDAIQFVYTTIASIPSILLIISLIMIVDTKLQGVTTRELIFRDDLRFFGICCILGLLGWSGLCRMLRAETLKLKTLDYVQAAEAMGAGPVRVMSRHILPNVTHIILIAFILSFSSLVMVEVILQYINIGVPAGIASWGRIIDNARMELSREPIILWPVASAFFAMFFLVFAVNFLGDIVRDALDPRLKGGE